MISFVGKWDRCCSGATNLRIPQLWRGLAFSLVLGFAPLSLQAESLFSWTITQVEEKLFVRCTTASREFRVTGRVACAYRFSDRRWIFGETTFDLEAWKGRKVIGMATFQLRCDREEHTSSGS